LKGIENQSSNTKIDVKRGGSQAMENETRF